MVPMEEGPTVVFQKKQIYLRKLLECHKLQHNAESFSDKVFCGNSTHLFR